MNSKELNKLYKKNKKESIKLLGVKKKSYKYFLISAVLLSVLLLATILALPSITYSLPANNTITDKSYQEFNFNFTNEYNSLNEVNWTFDNIVTILFNNSVVGYCNFDNRSILGENDTKIVCWSPSGGFNGTVIGGSNITWSNTGKYGGTFNFSGNVSYIDIPDSNQLDTNETTIMFWFKTSKVGMDLIRKYESGTTKSWVYSIFPTGDSGWVITSNGTSTATSRVSPYSPTICNDSKWHNVILTYNLSYITLYFDGNLVDVDAFNQGIYASTSDIKIGSHFNQAGEFNGSFDDFIILNRSISQQEAYLYYKFSLTNYNNTDYAIYINQTLANYNSNYLNSSNPNKIYQYNLCLNNLTLDKSCLGLSNLIKNITSSNIVNNYTNKIATIRNDFYGISSEEPWFSNLTWIDINGDGKLDTPSNYTWHRKMLENSGIKYGRFYLYLNKLSVSEGVLNYSAPFDHYSDINTVKSLVDYYRNINGKILFSTIYVPSWLADRTSGYCNWTTISNQSCNPSNYSKYGNLVVDVFNAIGCSPDVCELEVGNEPDYSVSWLDNVSTSNGTRSIEYNKLYNATYLAIKSLNSSYQVGGPVTTSSITVKYPAIISNWMGNFSNNIDFIDVHNYLFQANTQFNWYNDSVNYDINWIKANITSNGVNVSRIIFSELNLWNATILNTSSYNSYRRLQAVNLYLYGLNNYPANLSLLYWQWADQINYTTGKRFELLAEPKLDNYVDVVYYVLSNMSHLCPAGATVYVTSGDDATIKQVSCKKGNMYSLIVINTGTEAKNVTLNMSMTNGTVVFPYSNLVNYEDDTTTYKVSSDGISQLGVMDSYEILYLYSGVEDGALLRGVFKLNEYSGNTLYDSQYTSENGTRSGATWVTDGILNTLANGVDYTVDLVTGLLTIVNTDYLYEYLFVDYDYKKIFGFHVSILELISGFLMIVILGIAIIYVSKYIQNLKEVE